MRLVISCLIGNKQGIQNKIYYYSSIIIFVNGFFLKILFIIYYLNFKIGILSNYINLILYLSFISFFYYKNL